MRDILCVDDSHDTNQINKSPVVRHSAVKARRPMLRKNVFNNNYYTRMCVLFNCRPYNIIKNNCYLILDYAEFNVAQIPSKDYIEMQFEQEELQKKMHVHEAGGNVAILNGNIDIP